MCLKVMSRSHLCFLNVSLLSCGHSTDFVQAEGAVNWL